MVAKKLVISGLSEIDRKQFYELVESVKNNVATDVRSKIDASVLGRFAINSFLKSHIESPKQLTKLLGFEVNVP